jgi:hypothetical protein
VAVPPPPSPSTRRAEVSSGRPPGPPPLREPAAPDGPPTESRADYVARNAARCRDGDRRACAAVTCERSGRLDSPACQEAVGYLRGPGWDLRPRSDLFDSARTSDEFTLTCRDSGRRATLTRARGVDAYAWPPAAGAAAGSSASAPVTRAALPDAAREFCARAAGRCWSLPMLRARATQ